MVNSPLSVCLYHQLFYQPGCLQSFTKNYYPFLLNPTWQTLILPLNSSSKKLIQAYQHLLFSNIVPLLCIKDSLCY